MNCVQNLNKAVCILMLLLIPTLANAEYKFAKDWSKADTAWECTFLAITAVDWAQTHWAAKRDFYWDGHQHHENNPFLGSQPSTSKVDTLIPLGMAAHVLVAMVLPSKFEVYDNNLGTVNINFRRIWQCTWIGVEVGAVAINYSAGIRLEF